MIAALGRPSPFFDQRLEAVELIDSAQTYSRATSILKEGGGSEPARIRIEPVP
ncbi:MAG: hypothetical protein ABI647_05025 [Gemmatimonadota bacterium]